MIGRPELAKEGARSQELVEKVAEITDVLFRAPHAAWSYLAIFGLPQVVLPFVWPHFGATYWEAAVVIGSIYSVPAMIAAAGGWRLASVLGGSFNRRRSGFVAASGEFFALVILLVGDTVARLRGGAPGLLDAALLSGLTYIATIQLTSLFTTSDHRLVRSAQVAVVQPLFALVIAAFLLRFSLLETLAGFLLLGFFLASTAYALLLVDVPVRRTTGVSFSLMFRYYIDHLSRGTIIPDDLFVKTAGHIDALIGVVGFRNPHGIKAAIVVPAVHPGPIGELGGSNLPTKIMQVMGSTANVLVPHGSATHDYNPIGTSDVERLGEAARRLLDTLPFQKRASPLLREGEDAQVCAQAFGESVLLTYTSWPRPIDDIDYGVGEAARFEARLAGASDAIFIDAHNSLLLGAGAVWPSTRRYLEIRQRSSEATKRALQNVGDELQAGYAQTKDAFTMREGIGTQGCQVLATEVGGKRSAYILWDGNNMLPDVRGRIRQVISDLVEEFEVMTTDNHSVNIVTGGYNPVGYRTDIDRLAAVTRDTLLRALDDLEPVEVGLKTTRVPDLRVFGQWNTMRFVAAVQTMIPLIPRTAALLVVFQTVTAALILLTTRLVAG